MKNYDVKKFRNFNPRVKAFTNKYFPANNCSEVDRIDFADDLTKLINKSKKESGQQGLPEHHVFKSTLKTTGGIVWQYFYKDRNQLNQHSRYFPTRYRALEAYKRFINL